MTYHYLMLRTETQGEMEMALANVCQLRNPDLLMIGALYKDTGDVDAEGNQVMASVSGYHANIVVTDDAAVQLLAPITVTPATASYGWPNND